MAGNEETDDIRNALTKGRAEFMGREFRTAPGVLVPRAITEVVVRACRAKLDPEKPALVADVGCGSGIVGLTLALEAPQWHVVCLDIAPEAVRITRENIALHGLGDRVEALESDVLSAVAERPSKFDLVASSPPFISSGRLTKDRAHLLELEPKEAFDAGPYGISMHQRLISQSKAVLRTGGVLVMEVGEGQDRQVRKLFERAGYVDITDFKAHTGTFVAGLAARLEAPPA